MAGWGLPMRRRTALALLGTLAGAAFAGPTRADTAGEDDGVITIGVYGDSLGEGIWGGLYRRLQRDRNFAVIKRAQQSTGLARDDYFDWSSQLQASLEGDDVDVAVFAIGLNDMQPLHVAGRQYYRFGTPEWNEAYAERISDLMKQLNEANVPTFWVGLPIMRDRDYADNIRTLNAIYDESAAQAGIAFVPLWDLTADEAGAYTAHFDDSEGRTRLMRANDGIHFTTRGYDWIADRVFAAMQEQLHWAGDDAVEH